jgi:hypothetical protein
MSTTDYLLSAVEGVVHEPTQRRADGLDLTVGAVYELDGPGAVDFGGGELAAAEVTERSPEKRDPEDDYGWWEPAAETVLLEYNERLTGGVRARLEPRSELLERGASHPTVTVESLPRVPLSVPAAGVALKENARVSTLRLASRP